MKVSERERALVKTNNSLPSLAISVLQVTEDFIPVNYPIGVPPDPVIELQLNFSYLPKIAFVIPEERTECQRYWRNLICRKLSEEDDRRDNISTFEVILLQVYGPSKARRINGYSSDGVAMGASQTCKIKQSRRAHFDPGEGDWVYNRRRRVQVQRRFKLHPRGDGPFHVLALIGSKGYNLGIEGMDLRTSPFEEGKYNMIRDASQFIKILMIVGEREWSNLRLQIVDKAGHLHVRATESIILKTISQLSNNMLGDGSRNGLESTRIFSLSLRPIFGIEYVRI